MRETWVQSLGWEDPLEKGKATHSRLPTLLPGEFLGLYSPWGRKESGTTERLSLSHSLIHEDQKINKGLFFFLFAKSCPILCYLMDHSSPGSSVHGILQARILKWVAISFSRWPSWPKDWTHVSSIGRQILYHWTASEAHRVPFSPHPAWHLLFTDFFDDGHSDWCEVITHFSYDLCFSNS